MADRETESRKRARSDGWETEDERPEGGEDEPELEDDEDIGPMPLAAHAVASQAKRKKRRETPHERLLLDQLPSAGRYYRSFMHRDTVSWVTVTRTNFLVTASVDGHIKFWKKKDPEQGPGIEFAKHYRAHLSPILGVSASADGAVYATIAADGIKGSAKVFDVANFDMINMLKLPFIPAACCWVHKPGQAATVLAIADRGSPAIHLYDGRGSGEPIAIVDRVHRFPVHLLSYNPQHDCVVSADAGGMIEYWRPSAPFDLPTSISWSMKSQTDLFVLRKSKTVPSALTVSPGGTHFALTSLSSQGHLVRIFAFGTGRLLRAYDEGTAAVADMQQAGTADWRLDEMEFGRRLAAERELAKACDADDTPGGAGAPVFDQSGNFLIYPSLLGIKIVNIHTNKVVRVLGKDENNRFLQLGLFQSTSARKPLSSLAMAASDNPLLQEGGAADPTLFCTAFKRSRFYFFNRLEPESDDHAKHADRDIFNEKPTREEQAIAAPVPASSAQTGTSAVIHTTLGDIHCRLFPDLAPKTVENFASLARSGYYAGVIFHRVIKKFMLQTGDPLGNGTGGESIWGGNFEDEFHPSLKHDRPYCLSMANAGPNTNGSQFFITTTSCPWLDNKHSIFGRCTGGFDVVHSIENVRCDKTDKPLPEYEVKITSISIA